MIDLNKPMIEREPLDLIEHTYYSLRLEHDALVRSMEQLQAAGAGLVEMQEVEAAECADIQTVVDVKLLAASVSRSLLAAYRELEPLQVAHKERIAVFRSYLELHEVEVAESMKELLEHQE